ncbi:MAG: mechanosensitive ion channel [Clostridia bacterium]|nr:mechanosensitive ion channel [Clostridia bacterium]
MNWEQFFVNGGLKILELLAIFVIGYIIIFILKKIIYKILNKSKLEELSKKFIFRIIVVSLYTGLVLILIQNVGIPVTGLMAILAAFGLAAGLALQDSLSSLANGIILIFTKPFKKDDSVTINGISGKVVAIQFFNTLIDTWDNKRVIIPNKNVVNFQIENSDYHEIRRFSIKFSVTLNTDIKKLREIAISTLLSNEKILTNPEPNLFIKEINDNKINVEVRAWTVSEYCDKAEIDMQEVLFNELKRNEIEIATNSLIVYSEHRPKVQYDASPLPKRDINKNPQILQRNHSTFDERLDNVFVKKLKPKKLKKIKSDNQNQEMQNKNNKTIKKLKNGRPFKND